MLKKEIIIIIFKMNDDSIHISSHLLDELIADIDNTKEQIDHFHNSPSTDVNEDNLEQYDYDINEDEIINEINTKHNKHIKEYNNILEQFEFDIQIDYHKDILEERLPTESNTIKTNTFYHLKQPSFYDVMTNDVSEHLIENDFGLNEHRLTTLLIENVKSRNRKPRILSKVFRRNKHSTISFYRDDNQLEASGYIGQCGQCFIY